MRDPSAAFLDVLQGARDNNLIPRRFVWVTAQNRDTGEPENIGLWTGDDPVTASVISGTTGSPVSRAYVGGVNLHVPAIPRVSDLTVQRFSITMSQIADPNQLLVRGHDPRLARVEIHDGLLDSATRTLVSPAEIAFLGIVDGTPIETPEAGGEGSITLEIISEAIAMLTRTNPAKRSHEHQQRRAPGDNFALYAGTVGEWDVWWGDEPAR